MGGAIRRGVCTKYPPTQRQRAGFSGVLPGPLHLPRMRGRWRAKRRQRGQVSEACANVTQAPSLPSPHAGEMASDAREGKSPRLAQTSHRPPPYPPPQAGEDKCPRSRGAPLRPSYVHATVRKPFVPPLKEGRRSADRRTTGFRPASERKACKRCGALRSPLVRIGAELKRRRARLSALHRDHAPRVLSLDSVPGRASWNHRIQTGEPSPAPVQPAPGSPVTRRTVDAQNRPETRCIAALPGTALVPLSKVPSRKAPR